MEVKADPKASSEYGKEGSGTTIGDNPRKRVIEIINAYYQWLMYFREKGLVRIPGARSSGAPESHPRGPQDRWC